MSKTVVQDSPETFVGACLAGDAFIDDVDDWVARWHDAPEESSISELELNEYLGLDDAEYALFLHEPRVLRFVVAAHRRSRPVDELLVSRDDYALAARSEAPGDARRVLDWLVRYGLVDASVAARVDA
jgi:hypothetical protein